jgi:hypothetical protein
MRIMYMTIKPKRAASIHEPDARCLLPDPLDPDSPCDFPVITTRRRLIRLALVAAETGARFQREGMDEDPMAWMLASRELFDGRDAVEAALELQHCNRAILLHGLGLGLDADPAAIDDLCTDDPVETCAAT